MNFINFMTMIIVNQSMGKIINIDESFEFYGTQYNFTF